MEVETKDRFLELYGVNVIFDVLRIVVYLLRIVFFVVSGYVLYCEFCFFGYRRLVNGLVFKLEVWFFLGGLVKDFVLWDGDIVI